MESYYICQNQLSRRFDKVERQREEFKKTMDLKTWQQFKRDEISRILGLDTFENTSLDATIEERCDFEDYTRDLVVINTEPEVRMPFYVLTPKFTENAPALIAIHGHGGGKEIIAGDARNAQASEIIKERPNADFGLQLMRQGFTVYCPDVRGFGQRREPKSQGEDITARSCTLLNHMGLPLGQPALGMFIWDLMKLEDYITANSISKNVSVAGMSCGGMQALFLAALDKRIRCAVVSGYFYGVKESLLELAHICTCNFVPHLWEAADMGDIGSLIAPRPLLIESGTLDKLNGRNGIANVISQVETAKRAYRKSNAEDNLVHFIFEGGHMWNGEKTIPFLKKHA